MRNICLAFAVFFALLPEAFAQAGTGTIKGKIHLSGKLPGHPVIRMGMDPMCAKSSAGKRIVQEYVVATADGSLANVFGRVQGIVHQTPFPTTPVTRDVT